MHPGDFTPVCTTELGKAASKKKDFEKRNVKLCGFSCDGPSSHSAWIEDIETATGAKVDFPLFCDPGRDFATKLGILDETNKDSKGLPLTVRSVYILKPDKTIALMMTYPASTGRNFDEILRTVDSVQLTSMHQVATPVDWKNGGRSMPKLKVSFYCSAQRSFSFVFTEDVIVNFPLSNKDADEKFGPGGYRVVELPSELGKDLPKNYLRYTSDPSHG